MANRLLAVFAAMVVMLASAHAQWDPRTDNKDRAELIEKARAAIATFREADPSLETYFREAYGYAVFPSVKKGAAGIGGARGKGVVFRGGEPALKAKLSQFTIGAQIGGKTFSQIIFFRDAKAYDAFADDAFEFSAEAQAVVASDGAGTRNAYDDGVAIFVRDKAGAMVEASVGGQNFEVGPFE